MGFEARLKRRYTMLVAAHSQGLPELAAGMKALPDTATSFSHTQALWRFLHNDEVTPARLAEPLLAAARSGIAESCERYALIAHDWSRLNYNRHRAKPDRLQMTHQTDLGYELQSSLVIGDHLGDPICPVAQNLVTADKVLSTYRPEHKPPAGIAADPDAHPDPALCDEAKKTSCALEAESHLDELSTRMGWLEAQALGRPLVHIVDREADSVAHLRQWTAAGQCWLIRAKAGSTVRAGEHNRRLDAVAEGLDYQAVRAVEHQGKTCRQWVAQTTVVLARPARSTRKDAQGRRVKAQPGAPIQARLVVSRILNEAGQCVATWYLLCNLPNSVEAATVALWYYFRWRIESFFKLLKQGGQQLEQWEQESGPAIFKRLLIASQACSLTWRILRARGTFAEQAQRFLVRLSGRQTKRARPVTAPAVLAGLHVLFSIIEVLEHQSLDDLKAYARFAFPERYQ